MKLPEYPTPPPDKDAGKSMNTPETDQTASYEGGWDTKALRMTAKARSLEQERDRARVEAERWRDNWKNGRTMSMIVSTKLPWENDQ